MAEWWFNSTGQNLLTGIVGDDTTPALLADEYIADFLNRIPEARASYQRIRASLTAAEQVRIDALYQMAVNIPTDTTALTDAHQHKWNTAGIHTAGRYGGTRRGGNA